MLDLSGKRVLVIGLGISGISAARFCAAHGASVVATDDRVDVDTGEIEKFAEISLGNWPDPHLFDLVVPSPGIARERYAGRAHAIWGDIELTFRAMLVPFVAVTGTNGKSTTVRLVETFLKHAGLRVSVAGNVGEPALSLVEKTLDVAILEVSSFQLESVDAFRPKIAVLLNLSQDHLDRHKTFEAYMAAKSRIFANQKAGDIAVTNNDEPACLQTSTNGQGDLWTFGVRTEGTHGWWNDDTAVVRWGSEIRRIKAENNAFSKTPRPNVLAALLTVGALGIDPESVAPALTQFVPLPHRLETVCKTNGVTWVNDSKATNPGAASNALESFRGPVIWIAGGRDKGLAFDALAEIASHRVKVAILFGECAPKLVAMLKGRVHTEQVVDIKEAVSAAARLSSTGDVVLLSPACSSFDHFSNFEERGDQFRIAVTTLLERP